MDLGGAGWLIIDVVAVLAFAGVLFFVLVKNRRERGVGTDRTEAGTRELYREEEEARRRGDDSGD
jgi:hypothetical protein